MVIYGLILGGALGWAFVAALPKLMDPEAARAAGTLRLSDAAIPATFAMFGCFLLHLATAFAYGLLRLMGGRSALLKAVFLLAGIAGIAAMFWLGRFL